MRTLWIAAAAFRGLVEGLGRPAALTLAVGAVEPVSVVAGPSDPGIVVATVSAAVVGLVFAIRIPSARFWL